MARKQRNDVDYFPHPVNHGKKMFYLRQKYGNDAYTAWFMLLENLGKSEYHYIDLKDKVALMYLSSELMIDEEKLLEIIELLVEFGELDSELWEERIIFNLEFIESIEDAYKKRSNEITKREDLIQLLTAKGRLNEVIGESNSPKGSLKVPVKPQSKVKESKEEKTKEEESKSSPSPEVVGLKKEDFLKERKFIEDLIISKNVPEKILIREYTAFLGDKEALGGGRIMEEAGEVKKHFLNVINKMLRDGKISYNVATGGKQKQSKTEPDIYPDREKFEALGGNEKLEQGYINALLGNDWDRFNKDTWETVWENKTFNLKVDLSKDVK